jgi:hypothetical protein
MRGQLEKKICEKKRRDKRKEEREVEGQPFFSFFPFPRTISGSLVQFRQKPKTAVEIASLASKLTREKIVRIFK